MLSVEESKKITPYTSNAQEKGKAVLDETEVETRRSLFNTDSSNCVGTFDEKFFIAKYMDPLVIKNGACTRSGGTPVLPCVNGVDRKKYPTWESYVTQHHLAGICHEDKPFLTDNRFAPLLGGDCQVRYVGKKGMHNDDVCVVINPTYKDTKAENPGWMTLYGGKEWGEPIGKIGFGIVAVKELTDVLRSRPYTTFDLMKWIEETKNGLKDTEKNELALKVNNTDKLEYLVKHLIEKKKDTKGALPDEVMVIYGSIFVRDLTNKHLKETINNNIGKLLVDLQKQIEEGSSTWETIAKKEMKATDDDMIILRKYVAARFRETNWIRPWLVGRLLRDAVYGSLPTIKLNE